LTKFVPGCNDLTGTWLGRVAYSARTTVTGINRRPASGALHRDKSTVYAHVQRAGRSDHWPWHIAVELRSGAYLLLPDDLPCAEVDDGLVLLRVA
jgi:hypothetical protein